MKTKRHPLAEYMVARKPMSTTEIAALSGRNPRSVHAQLSFLASNGRASRRGQRKSPLGGRPMTLWVLVNGGRTQ